MASTQGGSLKRSWSLERQAAASGIVAVLLLIVGNFIVGQPPKFTASAATVTNFFQDHHTSALVGMILTGLAIPFYVWFVAHLALTLRGPLGATVALGALFVAAAAAIGDAMTIVSAIIAKNGGEPQSVRLAFETSAVAYGRLLWGGIAVAVAVALAARRGSLPGWIAPLMWVQAILMLLGGVSLKSTGFLSPTGGMALIAFLAYFVGTLAIAVAYWQASRATAEAPAAATSAA